MMTIVCPGCSTSYDVEDNSFGEKVQCPECGTKWILGEKENNTGSDIFRCYELPPVSLLGRGELRSVFESKNWRCCVKRLPVLIGSMHDGSINIADLADSHFVLLCSKGQKNSCINSIIISLLLNCNPSVLKLILIDLRVVNFEVYRPLPHLICPVVNELTKVPDVLGWVVNEMEHRYRQLTRVKMKNIEAFNNRPFDAENIRDENGDPIPQQLPSLVIIVDEFADIMIDDAISRDITNLIFQIVIKGTMVGIHIIFATELLRHSDFIEKLESYQSVQVMRFTNDFSGFLISDFDIQKISDFVSSQCEQYFNQALVSNVQKYADEDEGDNSFLDFEQDENESSYLMRTIINTYLQPDDDENIRKAVEIILREKKASSSYLQRRMGIGYNKATEIMNKLEQRGIVSAPLAGGQKRDILIFDEFNSPARGIEKLGHQDISLLDGQIVFSTADERKNHICAPLVNDSVIDSICDKSTKSGDVEKSVSNASHNIQNQAKSPEDLSLHEEQRKSDRKKQTLKFNLKKTPHKNIGNIIVIGYCLCAVIAILILIWIVPWSLPSAPPRFISNLIQKYQKSKHEAFLRDVDKFENGDPIEIISFAQQTVEKTVKSPASLRFQRNEVTTRTDKDYKMQKIVSSMEKDPKKMWFVSGEFDAQNSFGAIIRTRYAAIIEYEGNGRYKLHKLDFTQ